jgi:pilus assembly protein Flp/PilA
VLEVLRSLRRFVTSEDGPTSVEYAVMLALIFVVCFAAIGLVGTNTNKGFKNPTLNNAIGAASS